MAEAVRHPHKRGDPEDADGQGGVQPAADLRLRQVQVPEHEVRADEEGAGEGDQEDGRLGAHQAAQAGLLQRDAEGTELEVAVRN